MENQRLKNVAQQRIIPTKVLCPADTDAHASKSVLFTIFSSQIPLAGKLYKTVTCKLNKTMNTEEFVKSFHTEKQDFLKEYLSENPETEVGRLIQSLNLTDEQNGIMEKIINGTLTDVFYTILLGLDGCASIGGIQEMYDLKDENGNQLSGEIEGYAYEYFHESD